MFSRSLFSLSLLLLILASSIPTPAQAITGAPAFNQQGYPTIAIVGIVLVLILSLIGGAKNGSTSGLKTYIFFVIFNVYIWLAGFFLIFGPEVGPPGSRLAVIGLALAFLASLGFYACMLNLFPLFLFYTIFGIWNLLNLIGSNGLFNYNFSVWTVATGACNGYFLDTTLDRCVDDKFLQFLRVIGTSVIIFIAVTVVQSFTYWVEGGNKSGYGRGAMTGAQAPPYNNAPGGREGQGLVVQPQHSHQPPPV